MANTRGLPPDTAGKRVASGMAMGYNGKRVERGEVFILDGAIHDTKLFEHNYIKLFEGEAEDCDICQKSFASEGHMRNHQREQHPVRERVVVGRVSAKRTPDKPPAQRGSPEPASDQEFAKRERILAEL